MLEFLTLTLLPSLPLPRVIPMTPVGPCLPGHRSVRPYTVFELEQVRQQSRKYGSAAGSCEGFAGGLEGESGGWGGVMLGHFLKQLPAVRRAGAPEQEVQT